MGLFYFGGHKLIFTAFFGDSAPHFPLSHGAFWAMNISNSHIAFLYLKKKESSYDFYVHWGFFFWILTFLLIVIRL